MRVGRPDEQRRRARPPRRRAFEAGPGVHRDDRHRRRMPDRLRRPSCRPRTRPPFRRRYHGRPGGAAHHPCSRRARQHQSSPCRRSKVAAPCRCPRSGGARPRSTSSPRGAPTVARSWARWPPWRGWKPAGVAVVGVDSNESSGLRRRPAARGGARLLSRRARSRTPRWRPATRSSRLPVSYFLDADGQVVGAASVPRPCRSLKRWVTAARRGALSGDERPQAATARTHGPAAPVGAGSELGPGSSTPGSTARRRSPKAHPESPPISSAGFSGSSLCSAWAASWRSTSSPRRG